MFSNGAQGELRRCHCVYLGVIMKIQVTINSQTFSCSDPDKIMNMVLELNGGGMTEQQTRKTMLDLETLAKHGEELSWKVKGKVVTLVNISEKE